MNPQTTEAAYMKLRRTTYMARGSAFMIVGRIGVFSVLR
jgi:hypothetical protein